MLFEIETDSWLEVERTWRVERSGKKVKYYFDKDKTEVQYANTQAAKDALEAFIAAKNNCCMDQHILNGLISNDRAFLDAHKYAQLKNITLSEALRHTIDNLKVDL